MTVSELIEIGEIIRHLGEAGATVTVKAGNVAVEGLGSDASAFLRVGAETIELRTAAVARVLAEGDLHAEARARLEDKRERSLLAMRAGGKRGAARRWGATPKPPAPDVHVETLSAPTTAGAEPRRMPISLTACPSSAPTSQEAER